MLATWTQVKSVSLSRDRNVAAVRHDRRGLRMKQVKGNPEVSRSPPDRRTFPGVISDADMIYIMWSNKKKC